MIRNFVVSLFLLAPVALGWAQGSQGVGEQAFNTTCFACHTIGGGRLVGPDLAGIQGKRSRDWLIQFISSSQKMVRDGDAQAVAIVEEYSGMIMPDALLSSVEVESVLDYITTKSVLVDDAEPEASASEAAASSDFDAIEVPDDVADQVGRGRHLFEGTLNFKNRGPTCNACHHVNDQAVLGGGALAAELTTVFSRMSAAGIRAIVGQAPFPAMQVAYAGKPLTEHEITDLVAYLRYANAELSTQTPKDYGVRLFVSGVVGSAALFGFCGLVWRGRKRGSVYQDIYDRQLKSE